MRPATLRTMRFPVVAFLAIANLSAAHVRAQQGHCPPGYQGDLWVDPEIGGDFPNNGCPANPFKTITYALSRAPTTSPITIIRRSAIRQAWIVESALGGVRH